MDSYGRRPASQLMYLVSAQTHVEEPDSPITAGNSQHTDPLTRMPSNINNSTPTITSFLFARSRTLMVRIPQSLDFDRTRFQCSPLLALLSLDNRRRRGLVDE